MRRLVATVLLTMLMPSLASAAPSYYGWGAGAFLQGPEPVIDETAPTVTSARIRGTTLTVPVSEVVGVGAGGSGGFVIANCSGGAVTPTFVSVGARLTFSLSRLVDPNETGCELEYTQPNDGIVDGATNELATFTGQAIIIQAVNACSNTIIPTIESPINRPSTMELPLCV